MQRSAPSSELDLNWPKVVPPSIKAMAGADALEWTFNSFSLIVFIVLKSPVKFPLQIGSTLVLETTVL